MSLLNDILDLSKIEAGRMELSPVAISVADLVHEATHLLDVPARRKGLDLTCEVGADIPNELLGDPVRLRQVLVNLIGNAVKFTDTGNVSVKAEPVSVEPDKVEIRFSVHDTGPAIPSEKQGKIFESFSQGDGSTSRKHGGTGLGLTISLRLVELMQGRIWVESQPGGGSTFYFTVRLGRVDPVERHALEKLPHPAHGPGI